MTATTTERNTTAQDGTERLELVRAVRLQGEQDRNTCSWCYVPLPEERHGTGACNARCAVLFRAEQDGQDTCCVICEKDFTVSQIQRKAFTCSVRCRKKKNQGS